MNLTQMHERLRLEMLRRIQRGTLSVSLLARQTGFGQSHLSNFLRCRRQLSLAAMDRILASQHLTAGDLIPASQRTIASSMDEDDTGVIPVVTHSVALFEPNVRSSAVQSLLHLPSGVLRTARTRATSARRTWQRFVAVRISLEDAVPMDPLLLPEAFAVIDRHYNSLLPYRPNRPTLYAVRSGAHLTLRYVDFLSSRLVLRAHNSAYSPELLEAAPGESPNDLIAGRIAFILNEP